MILVEKITVKLCFTNTSPIWTPHYYRQFALSLGKERPYIFPKLNLFFKIQTVYMALQMSIFMWFDFT